MQIEEIYLCSHRLLNVAEMIAADPLKKYHLSLRQCWLLLYINHRHPDGTSVTELHKELCISKATLSERMKRLRCMDYIKVVCCKSDERKKKMLLSHSAKKVLPELSGIIQHMNIAVKERMIDEDLQMLKGIEKELHDTIKEVEQQ